MTEKTTYININSEGKTSVSVIEEFIPVHVDSVREFVNSHKRKIQERETLALNQQLSMTNAFNMLINSIRSVTPLMVSDSAKSAIESELIRAYGAVKPHGFDALSGNCEIGREFKEFATRVKNLVIDDDYLVKNWNYYFNYSDASVVGKHTRPMKFISEITNLYLKTPDKGLVSYLNEENKNFVEVVSSRNAPIQIFHEGRSSYFKFETTVGVTGEVLYSQLPCFPDVYKSFVEKVTKDLEVNGLSKSDIVKAYKKLKEEMRDWMVLKKTNPEKSVLSTAVSRWYHGDEDSFAGYRESEFSIYLSKEEAGSIKFGTSNRVNPTERVVFQIVEIRHPETNEPLDAVTLHLESSNVRAIYLSTDELFISSWDKKMMKVDLDTDVPFTYREGDNSRFGMEFEMFLTPVIDGIVRSLSEERKAFLEQVLEFNKGDKHEP